VRDAHGALIVYDITKESSFDDIEYWIDFVKNHGLNDCVKILVGNKTDLEQHREVSKADGKVLLLQSTSVRLSKLLNDRRIPLTLEISSHTLFALLITSFS